MKNAWMRRLALWSLVGTFALLGVATSEPAEGEGSSDDSTNSGGSSALTALEGTLRNGESHGTGPGAEIIAESLGESWVADDEAIAVQVVPGDPEHVVVVMRLDYLSEYSNSEREELLNSVAQQVDQFGTENSLVAIGIRGVIMFGATAVREPGGRWQIETGSAVSQDPLAAALIPAPIAEGATRQVEYARLSMNDDVFTDECDDDNYEGRCGESYSDRYTVEVVEGGEIVANMSSPELDCYLFLLGPDGEIVAQNDDHGGTLNSEITHTATAAGTYTVIAASLGGEDVGDYAIRIAVNPPAAG